jgi:hypothetical protein
VVERLAQTPHKIRRHLATFEGSLRVGGMKPPQAKKKKSTFIENTKFYQ